MWNVYDAIGRPGEETEILARHVRRMLGLMPVPVSGATLFGRPPVSGPGGYARWTLRAPPEGMRSLPGGGGLWAAAPDRPILITDLDQTVSQPSAMGFFLRPLETILPFEDAVEVLTRAAATHLIVYLTARDEILLRKTRQWLHRRGFPPGPVFCRHPRAPGRNSAAFKRRTVARLKSLWPKITVGIGDKRTDVAAYRANGVPAIRFGPFRPMDGVPTCSSWSEVARQISGTPG